MEISSQPKLHSQDWFNEQRDYWWNPDFLLLMSQRWELNKVQSVLDVGCGVGHWGQLLAGYLPQNATLTGIDQEPLWVEKAKVRASSKGLASRYSYIQGTAEALPFPDNCFDMVTCQTVLIHLPHPWRAIQEFMRVLKPGGLIAVAEPNNMAGHLVQSSVSSDASIEDILRSVRFFLKCERGKIALGLGNNSLGDLVPGLFGQAGLDAIQVFTSDKASPLVPPYKTLNEQVDIAQTKDFFLQEMVGWDTDESRRYFLAGGGTAEEFENQKREELKRQKETLAAIDAHSYHTAGGGVFYLVSGRKKI